ncbi:MAG: hypothetical protein WDN69_16190 [Aliidongia sp.]
MIAEAFRPNQVEIESWSTNFDRVLIKSSGADDPGTWYLADVAAQKVDPVGKTYPGPRRCSRRQPDGVLYRRGRPEDGRRGDDASWSE